MDLGVSKNLNGLVWPLECFLQTVTAKPGYSSDETAKVLSYLAVSITWNHHGDIFSSL
jgi:hypothetical protein